MISKIMFLTMVSAIFQAHASNLVNPHSDESDTQLNMDETITVINKTAEQIVYKSGENVDALTDETLTEKHEKVKNSKENPDTPINHELNSKQQEVELVYTDPNYDKVLAAILDSFRSFLKTVNDITCFISKTRTGINLKEGVCIGVDPDTKEIILLNIPKSEQMRLQNTDKFYQPLKKIYYKEKAGR